MDWPLTIEMLSRLLPAGAIIAAVVVGRAQLRAGRRATALTIAKNHYRATLELYVNNSDIVYLGASEEGYQDLLENVELMRRYRWLATITLFSLQELYFVYVVGDSKDKNWAHVIYIVSSIFKHHFLSERSFPAYLRSAYDPAFMDYIYAGLSRNDHPSSKEALSRLLATEAALPSSPSEMIDQARAHG